MTTTATAWAMAVAGAAAAGALMSRACFLPLEILCELLLQHG
jgi:hypothetical protein